MSDSVRPHRQQPTRLPRPRDSPGKNTGVGCHFLFQRMKVRRESEVAQWCLTLSHPVDRSPPGSAVPGTLQAGTLEWVHRLLWWDDIKLSSTHGTGVSQGKKGRKQGWRHIWRNNFHNSWKTTNCPSKKLRESQEGYENLHTDTPAHITDKRLKSKTRRKFLEKNYIQKNKDPKESTRPPPPAQNYQS